VLGGHLFAQRGADLFAKRLVGHRGARITEHHEALVQQLLPVEMKECRQQLALCQVAGSAKDHHQVGWGRASCVHNVSLFSVVSRRFANAVSGHRQRPEEPDKAKERLEKGEVAVVLAKVTPDRAPDQLRIDKAPHADDEGHQRFDAQRRNREPPRPAPAIGKAKRGDQVEQGGQRAQIDRQVILDAALEKELVDRAHAGRKRQDRIRDGQHIANRTDHIRPQRFALAGVLGLSL
jgi:hypothetical protein